MTTPPRPSLILFDLDGTLIDSLRDIQFCVNQLRDRHSLPAHDREAVLRGIGHGAKELVRRTIPELVDSEDSLERLYQELLTFYDKHAVLESRLYPGALEFLDRTRDEATLGIVSNKPLGITEKILRERDLTSYFATVRCPENSRVRKPDPGAILDVVEELGHEPASTWFVGDSCPDFATGCDAGVFTFGVRFGYHDGGEPGPDRWVDSYQELGEVWDRAISTASEGEHHE